MILINVYDKFQSIKFTCESLDRNFVLHNNCNSSPSIDIFLLSSENVTKFITLRLLKMLIEEGEDTYFVVYFLMFVKHRRI